MSLSKIKSNWERDMKSNHEKVYGASWGGQDVLNQLSKALKDQIHGSVFEIGCGGGRLTKWLFEMGASEVTSCDVHQPAINRAKKYEPKARYILSDGETLPELNQRCDIVFSWAVFLHLPDYLVQWYIMQAYKKADKLIFALPSFEYELGKKSYDLFIKNKAWRDPFFTGYFTHYTKEHIAKMCTYAGWKCKSIDVIRDREVLFVCGK